MLEEKSTDDFLKYFPFFPSKKTGISCKLSPKRGGGGGGGGWGGGGAGGVD